MTKLTFFFILSFILSISAQAQSLVTSEQKDVYKVIVLIGQSWTQNNLDTLEKYLDKDYVHTDVKGQIQDRASWLKYVKDRKEKNVINPQVSFEDVKIRVHGDVAFATGINGFTGQAYTSNDGNGSKLRKLRFTQVLIKENGIWKRLLFQATYMDLP